MSRHSFLLTVRYGNIIIGVYIGGSGSTELFCVRLARKAGAGSDEKHQHPVPLSGPQEWHGMPAQLPCQAVGGENAEVIEIKSIWSKIVTVHDQWYHLFNALFQEGLSPIFFLHRPYAGSLKMYEIPPLLL